MHYAINLEKFAATYRELEPLYRAHYAELCANLADAGIRLGDYNPRLDYYAQSGEAGHLKTFVLRFGDEAVGYSNVWVTHDMHNGEKIAREDAVYVTPAHRNGIGRRFIRVILEQLRAEGVMRGYFLPATDERAAHLWRRMGFKPAGQAMVYQFAEA